jgi:hypothetical protein
MEGEDVDRTSLAVHVERDLGRNEPARRPEESDDLLHDRGMIRIEQPIEPFSVPREPTDHPRAKRSGQLLERFDGHLVGVALLDPGDGPA